MVQPPSLLWFRRDLRLTNNPALQAALRDGKPIMPVFILDEESDGHRRLGRASRWWLGQSLTELDTAIAQLGGRLILRTGPTLATLRELVLETGACMIHFNRRYDPPGSNLDRQIIEALRGDGLAVEDHAPNYLHEPWQLQTNQGDFCKVFTPFWRRLSQHVGPPATHRAPRAPHAWPACENWPSSGAIEHFQYKPAWTENFAHHWQPGEAGARHRLQHFLEDGIDDYPSKRDYPAIEGTSRLSPHLAWGEISVHEAWHSAEPAKCSGAVAFRRELAWRDFNMHLYFHYPDLLRQPWRENFRKFPFRKSAAMLKAWQQGRTGFPLVDAAMRELWQTGWMHNRMRMVTASFLIKDQLIDWQQGETWFWDTLVDADPAQNGANWQWVAGCGFDAAPFFRIFNPVIQSVKFDPQGDYIRRWIPELAALSAKEIHQPWAVPEDRLAATNIQLDRTYPRPILDHAKARQTALAAFRQVSGRSSDAAEPDLFS
ncbi:cryptochrome/photolyase family protein [Dongia soli]|uniref:Deoxyribodipyrimidine photo-lyase n=1 Tax=Dongia soli TaxID=600628 RepID=A0ABU5E980_9PROT|nr:deoxyribodipyrimidine photo-lyase [Dongia soli]MDY0882883.1 deoxyribodipyrimidine photo-lyase [Dongia soli]